MRSSSPTTSASASSFGRSLECAHWRVPFLGEGKDPCSTTVLDASRAASSTQAAWARLSVSLRDSCPLSSAAGVRPWGAGRYAHRLARLGTPAAGSLLSGDSREEGRGTELATFLLRHAGLRSPLHLRGESVRGVSAGPGSARGGELHPRDRSAPHALGRGRAKKWSASPSASTSTAVCAGAAATRFRIPDRSSRSPRRRYPGCL